MFLQALPLAKHEELCQASLFDLARQVAPGLGQGGRAPPDQLGRPLEVRLAAIFEFDRPEQGVIVEPVRLVTTELLEGELKVTSGTGVEIGPGGFKQPMFERD